MRWIGMDQERREVWKGHVAVAMLLAVAIALSACKVGGVNGKVTLGKNQAPDTQATLGSAVAPTAAGATTPEITRPVAFDDAQAVYHAGRYGEAAVMFTAYTERKPDNAWGQYMLGLAAWKAGDAARSETAFRKALEIDPSHLRSWVNLSRVYLDVGQPDSALDYLDQAHAESGCPTSR